MNLTSLKVEKPYKGTASETWNAISSTNNSRIAPNLYEMEIFIDVLMWYSEDIGAGPEAEIDWPENNGSAVSSPVAVASER